MDNPILNCRINGLDKKSPSRIILDNHLNRLMIDHNGQADSITPDEIEGAYEIATIHNGNPSYFLSGWEGERLISPLLL